LGQLGVSKNTLHHTVSLRQHGFLVFRATSLIRCRPVRVVYVENMAKQSINSKKNVESVVQLQTCHEIFTSGSMTA